MWLAACILLKGQIAFEEEVQLFRVPLTLCL